MQLKEIKNIFHHELDERYPREEVDSFFYILIEHYLQLERFVLAIQPDLTITKHEEQPLFEALAQLRLQRPIQYTIGTARFMDMDFKVDENVLIPRPETEELVRWILEDVSKDTMPRKRDADHSDAGSNGSNGSQGPLDRRQGPNGPLVILDIGTGSGCIAISLAKNLPKTEVHALDISADALGVARKNARLNQVDVTFVEADILNTRDTVARYNIIVSNPPYVREQEKRDMHKNVTDYEPEGALFVPDENPFKFYGAIIQFAKRNLAENGFLYVEINQYLSEEVKVLFKSHGFSEVELRKDMFGNQRMLKCRIL